MTKCLVVLSGGQDSTTCLFWALKRFEEVHAVTFDYGQRHRREIQCARMIANLMGVEHEVITLGDDILKGTSPLVNKEEQLEEYEDHQSLPGGLEKTFVPMRNQLFLTIAANRAYVLYCNTLVTGVSNEDFGGYPDCRPNFIEAFIHASSLGTFTEESLRVLTPLMSFDKKETVLLALEMLGCYQALGLTHTSYDGEYPPKSKDHATLLRAKGFEFAGVPDPLILRAHEEGLLPDYPDTPNYSTKAIDPYRETITDLVAWVKTWERTYVV